MNYQEEIKALKKYHALCEKHGLKFDRSFEGLMNHPENIKLELIKRRIKQIRENYPLQKKVKKVDNRKTKSKKTIAKKKKGKAGKPPEKEIHITAKKLKRSEVEAGTKKRKVSKKRKPRKKRK